jgi:hypothetical protein
MALNHTDVQNVISLFNKYENSPITVGKIEKIRDPVLELTNNHNDQTIITDILSKADSHDFANAEYGDLLGTLRDLLESLESKAAAKK